MFAIDASLWLSAFILPDRPHRVRQHAGTEALPKRPDSRIGVESCPRAREPLGIGLLLLARRRAHRARREFNFYSNRRPDVSGERLRKFLLERARAQRSAARIEHQAPGRALARAQRTLSGKL